MSTEQITAVGGILVNEILTLEGFPDGSEATAFLSGSMVEGFGNPWSDIDVFIISDRDPIGALALRAYPNTVSQHFVADRRVDFEFWRPSHVRDMAHRLATIELDVGNWIIRTVFTAIEEIFIHRLRAGIPILNPDGFGEYQALFDMERFRRYQVQETIRHLDEVLEDACGMLESSDLDVALFVVRDAINAAMDAYCHQLGNTDPTRKWRVKRLEALDDGGKHHRQITNDFWQLQFPDAVALRSDTRLCEAYIEECIRFANAVVSWIQS